MTRNAAHVETLIGHMKSSMANPFDITAHPGVLLNIATSLHASLQVQSTLPNGLTKGQEMMESNNVCLRAKRNVFMHQFQYPR